MKYTAGTIAKSLVAASLAAIGAATAAAHGTDLSALDAGQWMIALGAGLTAGGGVFATPNKSTDTPTDAIITNLPVVVAAAAQAQSDLTKIKQAATNALGDIPFIGSDAQKVLDSFNLPRF